MPTRITRCCERPDWIDRALAKAAQFDDEPQEPDADALRMDVERQIEAVPFRDVTRFVNPAEWGKGGRRPVSLPQGVKNRAGKAVYESTRGYHSSMPSNAILSALARHGLAAIDENGEKWLGLLVGTAECGSEGARDQVARARIVAQDGDRWVLTNTWLALSYCMMPSGNYEVTCYLS
jgi:hypothetical protein